MVEAALQLVVMAFLSSSIMAGTWHLQKRWSNAGIVDAVWALSTGTLGALAAWWGDGNETRRVLVGALILLWGWRLGLYLLQRIRHEPEDGRYQRLRTSWGPDFQRRLFWFYQQQAVAVVVFAVPAWLAAQNPSGLGGLDLLGLMIWLGALTGESVADTQLNRFRSQPENSGRVCEVGLWRYSRHPNYFFEWLHWWAYVPLAWGAPWGWLVVLFPLAMLYLVLKVTGIPPTEARALASRGEAYRRYQSQTSAFVPWFRRKSS